MLKKLQIGNKTFPINIIQAPLAGVSCAPFRLLTSRFGRPAYTCSEMISCNTLIHQQKYTYRRFVERHALEGPVCFQLSGSDPSLISEASKRITAEGADLIDLNCGCPVKKIRRRGAGSSLLEDPVKLFHAVYALKKSTHLPISIKIRVGANYDENQNGEVARAIEEGGADVLVVHGRHWRESYDVPCRYDEIKFFVERLSIPVIGNGDIKCVESLKKMFATGCAGAMIGRAGVGQPWIIQQLAASLTDTPFQMPSTDAIGGMFIAHVSMLADLLSSEKNAIIQARKFAKYYARGIESKQAFCLAVNACLNLTELTRICESYFL